MPSSDPVIPARSPRSAFALAAAGALFGVAFLDRAAFVRDAWVWLALLALLRPIRRTILTAGQFISAISPPGRRRLTLAVFFISVLFLFLEACLHKREFFPKIHDEQMFLLQARVVAAGHLWMPPHPMADFFETFHVFVRPVYAPMYFPGTALIYGFGMLLHLPPWSVSLCLMAAAVAMVFRVTAELADGAYGLLAALLILALPMTRVLSIAIFSYAPMMLLGLLAVWAWLHWRRTQRPRWAAALGLFVGWALITRPVDALCIIVPLSVAMALDLRRAQRSVRVASITLLIAFALPFLSLQLLMDRHITGHWFHTPVAAFNGAHWPANAMGVRTIAPTTQPALALPQFRKYRETFLDPQIAEYRARPIIRTLWRRTVMLLHPTLVSPYLMLLLPVGLLALTTQPREAMLASVLLFLVAYAFFPSMIGAYFWMMTPAISLLVVLGARQFKAPVMQAMLMLALLVLIVQSFVHYPLGMERAMFDKPSLTDARHQLATITRLPAVVLFTFDPAHDSAEEEPVYNTATAWPDDASIIRAHDLGPLQNLRIFSYYPDRAFYRYDRNGQTCTYLGMGRDLASRE